MKTIFIKLVEHPLSLALLMFAAINAADFTVCAMERAKQSHAVRKGKSYPGCEYNGAIIKQKLPSHSAAKAIKK